MYPARTRPWSLGPRYHALRAVKTSTIQEMTQEWDPRTSRTIALHTKDAVIHESLTLSLSHTMTVLVVPVQYSMAQLAVLTLQGVGPAQNWYVVADGVNDQFSYEFGSKGEYGAPSQLDGHVPQLYAHGLTV